MKSVAKKSGSAARQSTEEPTSHWLVYVWGADGKWPCISRFFYRIP